MVQARHQELPLWLLAHYYQLLDSKRITSSPSSSHAPKSGLSLPQRQAALLSARAGAGDLAGVQWLRSQGCAWSSHACMAAARGGHEAVLRWLLAQRPACPLDAGLCALAAASEGRLAILQFVHEEVSSLRTFDMEACAEAAAAAGQMAVVDWLVTQDSRLRSSAASNMNDQAAAAAARQQVQQIFSYAQARAPAMPVCA